MLLNISCTKVHLCSIASLFLLFYFILFHFFIMIFCQFYLEQMVDFVREGFLGSSHDYEFLNWQDFFNAIILIAIFLFIFYFCAP